MSGIIGGITEGRSGTIGSFSEDKYVNIGKLRIGFLTEQLDGTVYTGSVPGDNAYAAGKYVNTHVITYTGFAEPPWIYACIETDAHEPSFNCVDTGVSTTSAELKFQSGREGYISEEYIKILVIGIAS